MTLRVRAGLLIVACALVLLFSRSPGCSFVAEKPTAVTYVYEQRQHPVPSGVETALDKLNQAGILATKFDKDTKDGTGEVPEQYKVPLEAATKAGLPSLVVTAKDRVLRVVKEPRTEEEVLEAAK